MIISTIISLLIQKKQKSPKLNYKITLKTKEEKKIFIKILRSLPGKYVYAGGCPAPPQITNPSAWFDNL